MRLFKKPIQIMNYKALRTIGSVAFFLILDLCLISYFNLLDTLPKQIFLTALGGFQYYIVDEFASFAPNGTFDLDFRSEEEKYMDDQQHKRDLITAKKDQLLVEGALSDHVDLEVIKKNVEKIDYILNEFDALPPQKLLS